MNNQAKEPFLTRKDLMQMVVVVILIVLVRVFILSPVKVDGSSMMPTLVDKQRLWSLKTSTPERFDIVNFVPPTDPSKQYIKRVIGLPGETVEYRDDQLYINGELIDEPYLDEYKGQLTEGQLLTDDYTLEGHIGIRTIPEGQYFVLGDNRQNSFDGNDFGLIDREAIIAVAKVSYWPPAEMKLIK